MSHNEAKADVKDSGYDKIYTIKYEITFLTYIDVSKVLPMIWDCNSFLSPGLQKILVGT